MFTVIYKSVKISAPEKRYLELLLDWYNEFQDGEVKSNISEIRWRELRPPLSWFRLIIVCRHPYPDDVEAFRNAQRQEEFEIIDATASHLLSNFEKWIDWAAMPREIFINERSARITWSAHELPCFDRDNFTPQERVQYDLNRQGASFLWLVHVSAQEENDFAKSVIGTNTPFISAGLLLTGHVRMILHFPSGFPSNNNERERLYDNLLEHPADFLILMRLAHHLGCHQQLIKKVLASRDLFLRSNASNITEWLEEYKRTESEDFLSTEQIISPKVYESLDSACESYRQDLLSTIQGYENDLEESINSFLQELPIPEGSLADYLLDEGEWWKRGVE